MKTVVVALYLAAIAIALHQSPQTSVSTLEAAVRDADESWAKAIASKSVEQTVSSYDAEALTAGSAMPSANGLAAVRAMWTKLFAQPEFSLTWKVNKVAVSESGTIAYSTGIWRMAGPDATGPYLAVWRKQPDGRWKVLIDGAWRCRLPQ
jgi:ketosteroid isomerase-like protein